MKNLGDAPYQKKNNEVYSKVDLYVKTNDSVNLLVGQNVFNVHRSFDIDVLRHVGVLPNDHIDFTLLIDSCNEEGTLTKGDPKEIRFRNY